MSIVNSPRAARNTYRDRLPALMAGAGVPFPETALIATRDPRAAPLALEAARRYIRDGQTDAASDLL